MLVEIDLTPKSILFLMDKKEDNFPNFFKGLWHEVEPLAIELFVYSFLIIAIAIISYLTDPIIPNELKENIAYIKSFVVIGALSLSAFHTLSRILIRVIKSINNEIKDKNGSHSVSEAEYKNDDKNISYKTKPNKLNPKSTNFDEIAEVKSEKLKKGHKNRK